jgi:glycerate 2-kinase
MSNTSLPILVAADSFKDALSAIDVCKAIANGLRERNAALNVRTFPLADGGDGSFDVLSHHLKLEEIKASTVDPLFRPIQARYGMQQDLAVIEMAQASGLPLLACNERQAAVTTSRGTGMLIADAIARGAKKIILMIGGSATTDGGLGVASALGWNFLDEHGRRLTGIGASLPLVKKIELPTQPFNCEIEVLCDVDNPLYGPTGAAYVYGPQKGADPITVEKLDEGLKHLATIVEQTLPQAPAARAPGAGAAGGLGYGAMAFLNARLVSGIDRILELAQFDQALSQTKLVITGEGSLDSQTSHGKLIQGLCKRAQAHSIPVIALCGRLGLGLEQIKSVGLTAAYQINDGSGELSQRLANTARDLANTARTMNLPI